jgi:hypothetical protein
VKASDLLPNTVIVNLDVLCRQVPNKFPFFVAHHDIKQNFFGVRADHRLGSRRRCTFRLNLRPRSATHQKKGKSSFDSRVHDVSFGQPGRDPALSA